MQKDASQMVRWLETSNTLPFILMNLETLVCENINAADIVSYVIHSTFGINEHNRFTVI